MEITISLQLRLFLISFVCRFIASDYPFCILNILHLNIRHLRGQRKCTPIRYNAYSREINHMFTVTFQISLYSNYLTFFSRNFISECLRYEQVGFLHALSHKKYLHVHYLCLSIDHVMLKLCLTHALNRLHNRMYPTQSNMYCTFTNVLLLFSPTCDV